MEVLKSLPHGLNEIGLGQDHRPLGRWCRFGGGEKGSFPLGHQAEPDGEGLGPPVMAVDPVAPLAHLEVALGQPLEVGVGGQNLPVKGLGHLGDEPLQQRPDYIRRSFGPKLQVGVVLKELGNQGKGQGMAVGKIQDRLVLFGEAPRAAPGSGAPRTGSGSAGAEPGVTACQPESASQAGWSGRMPAITVTLPAGKLGRKRSCSQPSRRPSRS